MLFNLVLWHFVSGQGLTMQGGIDHLYSGKLNELVRPRASAWTATIPQEAAGPSLIPGHTDRQPDNNVSHQQKNECWLGN